MKKTSTLISLLLAFCLLCTVLTGCGGTAKAEIIRAEDGLVVFKITEKMDNATVIDALNYLKQNGKLTFTSASSQWGEYITSVNGVSEFSGANGGKSWSIYSNDTDGSSTEFGSYTFDGAVFGLTANGASTQLVKEGCTYILSLESWS